MGQDRLNILFRKIKKEDLETIRMWRMLPEVTDYLFTDPVITSEDQMKWYRKISDDNTYRYWVLNVNDIDVGITNLLHIDYVNKKTNWGIFVGELGMRGRGISKAVLMNVLWYVFNVMNFNKLYCEALATNYRIIKCHISCGFNIEGYRREHVLKRGRYIDLIEMGILRKDWRSPVGYPTARFEE